MLTSFKKYSNIKFHENLFSGSQVLPSGWMDGRTDMIKLIDVFCNFENVAGSIPDGVTGIYH
jgi:hypothetical protein